MVMCMVQVPGKVDSVNVLFRLIGFHGTDTQTGKAMQMRDAGKMNYLDEVVKLHHLPLNQK